MLNKYNTNPIAFKIGNNVALLYELKYDLSKERFKIEVKNKNDEILFKKQFITLIDIISIKVDLDSEYFVNYYSEDDVLLLKDKVVIRDNNLFYSKMKSVVKKEIYKHSDRKEINKKYHVEMIKSCNHDNIAKMYVKKQISNILSKSFELEESDITKFIELLYADIFGLGIVQPLDEDKSISEIKVNVIDIEGTLNTKIIYIKENKEYILDKSFNTLKDVITVFNRVLSGTGKQLNSNDGSNIESDRPNKDRITITIPPFSKNYSLNIRRFENFTPDANNMRKVGTINEELEELFKILVEGYANIGIGGKMGVGKTSLINYLLSLTNKDDRKCVISTVDEIEFKKVLKDHDILIYNVNDKDKDGFAKAFLKAFRSHSSRIIVPEARHTEFKDIVKSCIQNKGNIFTAHATTNEDFLNACVDMYNYDGTFSDLDFLKNKIAKALDIFIIMHVVDKKIRVKSISEILTKDGNFAGFNTLYYWEFDKENPKNGRYVRTYNKLSDDFRQNLNENGVPLKLLNKW